MERPLVSNALEVVERLEAIVAPVLRLARRRAEFADARGILGFAAWTGDRQRLAQEPIEGRWPAGILGRRRDAVGLQPQTSFLGNPIRRPGWRKAPLDPQGIDPPCPQSRLNLECNDACCRTA